MPPPQWDVAMAPNSTLGSAYPPYWMSITKRAMRQASSHTGKQYELDAAQTGEFHPTLDNRDAAFSPVNTSSPYSPNVTAYKPIRWRAQYPATANILTVDQATGGSLQAAGPNVDAVVPVWVSYNFFWTVKAESDAFTGPNVFQQVISPAQAATAFADMAGWTVMPGAQHSAQCVMRATAGGTTPQARLSLLWRDASGNTISTVTGGTVTLTANSRTWQRLTVSGQAPANAAGCTVQIQMVNSVAVTWQASGFQVEYAAAPTAWATPGTWYPMFFGGAERWPQNYTMTGSFGQTQPAIVDAFALLANVYPPPAFFNEVLALNPDFFFPFNEPSAAKVFADVTGKRNPVSIVNSPYGSGSVTPGQGIQATTSPSGLFLGAPGPVTTFGNTVAAGSYTAATYVDLHSAGISGPPVTGWSRMIAFRCTSIPVGTDTAVWSWNTGTFQPPFGGSIGLFISNTTGVAPGQLTLRFGTAGLVVALMGGGNVCDGNWHLIISTVDASGINHFGMVDAFQGGTTLTSSINQNNVQSDAIGVASYVGSNSIQNAFAGDVAFVAQFPTVLTGAQMSKLYSVWRSAASPESSDARYRRILTYAGWSGGVATTPGATTAMGPAADIDGKTDALTLLQNVITTESGTHYVAPDGTITAEPRTNRYNKLSPTYIFGERTDLGEWPYEDVAFDFDTTRVIGQAQITQNSTGQTFVANAPTTVSNYRPTYQRTVNVVNPQECVDAANYLANRNAAPRMRVQRLRLHPAALAGLWPVALGLKISTRVRVMRRAPGVPLIQFDGFIESLKWSVDWDTWDAFLDLEISPADTQLYWVNAALRTTLFSQATAAGTTAVLSPLPDSASNSFSSSVCSGLQLTLEPGTVRAETLTVQSVSVTAPGYTSVTVTFTAALAFTHPINSVVCEALPAGVTDPSTWDAAAICGVTTTPSY